MKFLCFLLLSVSWMSFAKDAVSEYSKKTEKLIRKKGLKKVHLGLSVSLMPSEAEEMEMPLYSLNETRLFIPASLVKIASLSAFYHYFPLDFQFQTQLIASGPVSGTQLKGALIIKGGGDPGFTSESLWNLVNAFKRSGIQTIEGDILVDDSLYKPFKDKAPSNRSYYALPSASSFNWNSVTFWIRPDKMKAQIFTDPENPYIKTLNKIKSGRKTLLQVQTVKTSKNQELFHIKGFLNSKDEERVIYRNIQNPPLWMGYNLLHFLKQRGIKVKGTVKTGSCLSDCRILAKWNSRPLVWHTYNMMKFSNNFVSRMLTSHLPLLQGENKGDFYKGSQLIRNYLKDQAGLTNFYLAEPSGLSRKNQFSPKDIKTLLLRGSKRIFAPEMLSSYPLAKGIGTLKKRFETLSREEFVRAKTGSISGVLGLAGFAQNTHGEKFAFAFIYNGPNRHTPKARELFEDMIEALFL